MPTHPGGEEDSLPPLSGCACFLKVLGCRIPESVCIGMPRKDGKRCGVSGIFYLVAGVVAGGAVAWYAARAFLKGEHAHRTAELHSGYAARLAEGEGRAKGAEAVVGELRQQAQQKESELSRVREDLDAERRRGVETATRLEESHKRLEDSYRNLEQQKELVEVMRKEMTDTFSALSSAALKSSSEDFLRLASESLGKVVADTKGKLGEHQAAMDGTIKPLQELLKRYEQQIREMEESRHRTFGSLSEQLRNLSTMQEKLQHETNNLVTVLRRPKASGSWGELGLRRVAELAGMTAYCDFYEQESVSTDSGRLRPDLVVRLPNGRIIVIDAKAPVDSYLQVASAATEEERKRAVAHYIGSVRSHMNLLSSKSYWDQFAQSPEIVVMYLPGESFFSAAIEHDHKLIEDGSIKKVILATPTTFIALLKAIAYGWQQEQMTRNAQEISKLGKDLYERFCVALEHFSKTGTSLRKTVESYNEGVRSMETRLLPSLRRFRDLGVSSAREIESPPEVGQTPRSMGHLALEFDKE
ncbi:MAG: DNA recombination protein RmuC [Nitrospirales bacterium]|nr:DNA recombination protein RmuC [Nitrospirales bacterium]